MTKEEIQALIATKIEGQGNQVDSGGALAEILNGIIDLIPTPEEILDSLTVKTEKTYDDLENISLEGVSKAQVCSALGISTSDLDNMFAGKILRFIYADGSFPIGQTTTSQAVYIEPGNYGPLSGRINHYDGDDWDIIFFAY